MPLEIIVGPDIVIGGEVLPAVQEEPADLSRMAIFIDPEPYVVQG